MIRRFLLSLLLATAASVVTGQDYQAAPVMVPILGSDEQSVEVRQDSDSYLDALPDAARRLSRGDGEQYATVYWREVQATTSPVAEAARNAVRVTFPMGGGSAAAGSGVYLGEKLVATAYHVPRGTSGNGSVQFQDGTRSACRTMLTDRTWDLAVLEIESEHPSLTGVEVAPTNPRTGEMVYSCGFGQGFRIFGGRCTGDWFRPNSQQSTADWFHHENPAVSGDSGGPVFSAAGKLIGCLWGTNGHETVATGTGRFYVFVKPLLPRLAQWRAQRIANQIAGVAPTQYGSCPPGSQYCPNPGFGGGVGIPGYGAPGGYGYSQPSPSPDPPTTQPPVTAPPVTTPPTNPPVADNGCNCDLDAIAAKIDMEKLAGLVAAQLEVPEADVEVDYSTLATQLLPKLATDPRFRGAQGPPGPAGPTGPSPTLTTAQLEVVTRKLLAAISEQETFRGPEGPPGPAGKDGQRGPAGPPGSSDTIDLDAVAERVKEKIKGSIHYRVTQK